MVVSNIVFFHTARSLDHEKDRDSVFPESDAESQEEINPDDALPLPPRVEDIGVGSHKLFVRVVTVRLFVQHLFSNASHLVV